MSNELKYSQEDLDNILAKKVAKLEEKHANSIASDFVGKADFHKLQAENSALRKAVIQPKIEAELLNCGIKKECMNDFLALNKALFDCKEEDIKYNVLKCAKERPWMFNTEYHAETGNQVDPAKDNGGSNVIETGLGSVITRNK